MEEIFWNRQRSGYEEIMSYTPGYYKEIKEMDANFRFAGWTTDLMALGLEKLMSEQIIPECSIAMLGRLESFFGQNGAGLTEQERRKNLIVLMTGYGKMSAQKIQEIVKTYLGCECQVYWTGQQLQIRLAYISGIETKLDAVTKIFSDRIPAHISYLVSAADVLISMEAPTWYWIGASVCEVEHVEVI